MLSIPVLYYSCPDALTLILCTAAISITGEGNNAASLGGRGYLKNGNAANHLSYHSWLYTPVVLASFSYVYWFMLWLLSVYNILLVLYTCVYMYLCNCKSYVENSGTQYASSVSPRYITPLCCFMHTWSVTEESRFYCGCRRWVVHVRASFSPVRVQMLWQR